MTATFHCTSSSFENLEVVNWVNENTERLHLGSINEVVGVVVVYDNYQLMVFNVDLDFGSLWSRYT